MINRKEIRNRGKSSPIDEFLNTHKFLRLRHPRTKKILRSMLKQYFKLLSGNKHIDDDDTDLNKFKDFVNHYFTSNRDYNADMETYIQDLDNMGYSNTSKKNKIANIRAMLRGENIILDTLINRAIRNRFKNVRRSTDRYIPSKTELKKILEVGGVKEKALFLISATSGMRIDEILQLTLTDIDFNYIVDKNKVTKINVRAETTKINQQRITFISHEATEYLKLWLEERDQYLETSLKRCSGNTLCNKNADDNTIFCFSYDTARNIFNRICDKVGFSEVDQSTGLRKLSIQCIREYFKHHSIEIGEVGELLLGHADANKDAYREKYPVTLRAEKYLSIMPELMIFTELPDLTEHDERLKAVEQENQTLQKLVQELINKNRAFENIIANMGI